MKRVSIETVYPKSYQLHTPLTFRLNHVMSIKLVQVRLLKKKKQNQPKAKKKLKTFNNQPSGCIISNQSLKYFAHATGRQANGASLHQSTMCSKVLPT